MPRHRKRLRPGHVSRTYPQSVRNAAASMREEGMIPFQIARALGIPQSTLRRWFDPDALSKQRARFSRYSGTCADCGARTTGCNGSRKAPERCAPCTAAFLKTWTRDAIIEAIHLYAHRYGQQPSARDWNPQALLAQGRDDLAERFYRDGDYPASNVVQFAFGSWNAGIAAAGYTPRRNGVRGPGRPRV